MVQRNSDNYEKHSKSRAVVEAKVELNLNPWGRVKRVSRGRGNIGVCKISLKNNSTNSTNSTPVLLLLSLLQLYLISTIMLSSNSTTEWRGLVA